MRCAKLAFFVTINSVQNFKTVAHPLLGEKFVWWVVGWVVCKPILVFRFGPKALDLDLDQAEQLDSLNSQTSKME